jgi:hypothetical protein
MAILGPYTVIVKKTSKRTAENIWAYYQPMTSFRLEFGVADLSSGLAFSRPLFTYPAELSAAAARNNINTPSPPSRKIFVMLSEVEVPNGHKFSYGLQN